MKTSSLQIGEVFHRRIHPYQHFFRYPTFYLLLDLQRLSKLNNTFLFSLNRFNLLSFYFKDHGYRKENINPALWFRDKLKIKFKDKKKYNIYLYCTPAFFGYVFNPISIYLAYSKKNICYICYEVKNTHQEQHSYFFKITNKKKHFCKKQFYVSPFLKKKLLYEFYLNFIKNFELKINVYDKQQLVLKTGVNSKTIPFSTFAVIKYLIKNLFFAQKIMILIHYQAIKIYLKQKFFFMKPIKNNDTVSFHESSSRKFS